MWFFCLFLVSLEKKYLGFRADTQWLIFQNWEKQIYVSFFIHFYRECLSFTVGKTAVYFVVFLCWKALTRNSNFTCKHQVTRLSVHSQWYVSVILPPYTTLNFKQSRCDWSVDFKSMTAQSHGHHHMLRFLTWDGLSGFYFSHV